MVYNPAQDERFVGGPDRPSTLNAQPISVSAATSVSDGLTFLGCSPRVVAAQMVPILDRLLHAHGMYVRNGSGALGLCDVACGRLIGYVEPHINSWDCLGGIAVIEGVGGSISDYLTSGALLPGNRLAAGAPAVFHQLQQILG